MPTFLEKYSTLEERRCSLRKKREDSERRLAEKLHQKGHLTSIVLEQTKKRQRKAEDVATRTHKRNVQLLADMSTSLALLQQHDYHASVLNKRLSSEKEKYIRLVEQQQAEWIESWNKTAAAREKEAQNRLIEVQERRRHAQELFEEELRREKLATEMKKRLLIEEEKERCEHRFRQLQLQNLVMEERIAAAESQRVRGEQDKKLTDMVTAQLSSAAVGFRESISAALSSEALTTSSDAAAAPMSPNKTSKRHLNLSVDAGPRDRLSPPRARPSTSYSARESEINGQRGTGALSPRSDRPSTPQSAGRNGASSYSGNPRTRASPKQLTESYRIAGAPTTDASSVALSRSLSGARPFDAEVRANSPGSTLTKANLPRSPTKEVPQGSDNADKNESGDGDWDIMDDDLLPLEARQGVADSPHSCRGNGNSPMRNHPTFPSPRASHSPRMSRAEPHGPAENATCASKESEGHELLKANQNRGAENQANESNVWEVDDLSDVGSLGAVETGADDAVLTTQSPVGSLLTGSPSRSKKAGEKHLGGPDGTSSIPDVGVSGHSMSQVSKNESLRHQGNSPKRLQSTSVPEKATVIPAEVRRSHKESKGQQVLHGMDVDDLSDTDEDYDGGVTAFDDGVVVDDDDFSF
eukprot:Rmarinus@m.22441